MGVVTVQWVGSQYSGWGHSTVGEVTVQWVESQYSGWGHSTVGKVTVQWVGSQYSGGWGSQYSGCGHSTANLAVVPGSHTKNLRMGPLSPVWADASLSRVPELGRKGSSNCNAYIC